jgi:hypothetical protein
MTHEACIPEFDGYSYLISGHGTLKNPAQEPTY